MPRQSREKLTPDPDHGSYKLTLASNEDCIPTTDFHENIHPVKINNLPDVLPLGVKMKNITARYGSNNNLLNNTIHHKSSMLPTSMENIPQTAPALSAYSMKNMFHFNSNNNHNMKNQQAATVVHHNHSPSKLPPNTVNGYQQNGDAINQRYMSQSINDLKRAQHIFGSNELHFGCNGGASNKLSQADSDASLADTTNQRRNEFVNRGIMAECSPIQPKIHNCNQIHTISVHNNHNHATINSNGGSRLSAPSPVPSPNKDDKVIRTDSLKENIDKITQLQTKLMSAHSLDRLKDLTNQPAVNEAIPTNEVKIAVTDKKMHNDSLAGTGRTTSKMTSPDNSINEKMSHHEEVTNVLNDCSTSIESNVSAHTALTDDSTSSSRLNTSETASQTDDDSLGTLPPYCDSATIDSKTTYTALLLRTKYPEELDCEKLTESLVQQLAPTDRLHNILGELKIIFCEEM